MDLYKVLYIDPNLIQIGMKHLKADTRSDLKNMIKRMEDYVTGKYAELIKESEV